MRKERFLTQQKSKLNPRGNRLFQVLAKINDNTYKIDLPSEYNVSSTFNVSDLTPFDVDSDSRTNPFKERGNNEDQRHEDEIAKWTNDTNKGKKYLASSGELDCCPQGFKRLGRV